MSAVFVTAEKIYDKYIGTVQDYSIEWVPYIAAARVTAQSGTGAWSLVGETGSATNVYAASGMSASAVALTHVWTAYNSASGAGLTATGSASALTGLRTTFRITGGSASDRVFTWSAEVRTSSGRHLYTRFHYSIGS
jgi:hypothetical protein